MNQNQPAKVVGLFLKTMTEADMSVPANSLLQLKANYGIVDDSNASSISPRQLLVTCQEGLDEFDIVPGKLRENIAVQGLPKQVFVPGTQLSIGPDVKIRLTFYCEPCKRIEHFVPSLSAIHQKRGILGVVVQGGEVGIGDGVIGESNAYSPLSERAYERFLDFVKQIPAGKIVTYRHIIEAIGVTHSYYRALPGYIKRTSPTEYPLHRIVDSKGHLILDYLPQQLSLLEAEGVEMETLFDLFGAVQDASVGGESYLWMEGNLYEGL